MSDLIDYLNAATNARSDQELWNLHTERMKRYGFDRLLYGYTRYRTVSSRGDLDDMFLRDLVMLSDGSFYLIGETYYKYVDRSYDPRTNITTTTDHFNFNSIIVSHFNASGELQWHEHIPKFQNTTNDYGYYSSFSWMTLKDQLVLFYNDNEKNLELSVTDYFNHKDIFNNRRHAQTYVVINKDGIVKRSKLNAAKTNYLLYPRQSLALNNHTMYLMSEYDRHSKVISITFK